MVYLDLISFADFGKISKNIRVIRVIRGQKKWLLLTDLFPYRLSMFSGSSMGDHKFTGQFSGAISSSDFGGLL